MDARTKLRCLSTSKTVHGTLGRKGEEDGEKGGDEGSQLIEYLELMSARQFLKYVLSGPRRRFALSGHTLVGYQGINGNPPVHY